MKTVEIEQAIARGWCHPKNSHKVMDSDLAFAIAEEVAAALTAQADELEAALKDRVALAFRCDELLKQTEERDKLNDSRHAIQADRVRELEQDNSDLAMIADLYKAERDANIAKLDALSQQEPVAYVRFDDGEVAYSADDNIVISCTPGDCMYETTEWKPVYLAAGAQPKENT